MGVYTVKNTYNIADFYKAIGNKKPLQYDHQWIIEFIAPVGQTGKITAGDDAFGRKDHSNVQCFTYWAQSAKIPDQTITEAKIKFLANDFVVPGVIKYDESWQTSIILDQDLTQYKKLQAWHQLISDFSKSGGGKKVVPNVQAKLSLLDNTMQNVKTIFIMEGVWLQALGAITMQYDGNGGAALATCQATFEYQYFYKADDLEAPTDSDPLSPNAVDSILNQSALYIQ